MILELGENSLLKGSNAGKTLLNLSSMSMIVPLIFALWHEVREFGGGSKEVGGSLLTLIDRKSIYFVLSLFLFF